MRVWRSNKYEDHNLYFMSLQNFLCYSCKEYVDDLSRIPREVLEVKTMSRDCTGGITAVLVSVVVLI